MPSSLQTLLAPCSTPDALHAWVRLFTGLNVPRRAVCPHHRPPFEYLLHAYFEPARDQVVWAPRGGGKTRLAAVATLLDLLHKPGVSVRLLGGSMEQSLKSWEYLLPDVERLASALLAPRGLKSRRLTLRTGSTCAVLAQSQRAVRGLRVQKLRCDEVELFDPAIWEAAQLTTRSVVSQRSRVTRCGRATFDPSARDAQGFSPGCASDGVAPERIVATPGLSPGLHGDDVQLVTRDAQLRAPGAVRGSIEAISTLHEPVGLMARIVDAAGASVAVTKWCLLDVLARCEPERECATCPLFAECGGVAKMACDGFVPIDDAIAMKRRVSVETWESEMLCRRPGVRDRVFPTFDPAVHVVDAEPARGATWSLGVDFGFHNPFVCLWVATDERGQVLVADEYVQSGRTIDEHARAIEARRWPRAKRIACDPAGAAANDQTAASNVQVLRGRGYVVRHRASRIVDGVELIRRALRSADGAVRLRVHPRCVRLIAALQGYRYAPGGGEVPVKDGTHDHLIDALRYHFVNAESRAVKVIQLY